MNEEFIWVLQSKHNKLLSIYRKIKRQDDLSGHECPIVFVLSVFAQQQKKDVVLKVVAQSFEK